MYYGNSFEKFSTRIIILKKKLNEELQDTMFLTDLKMKVSQVKCKYKTFKIYFFF